MPGRRRTGSSPSRTSMCLAVYPASPVGMREPPRRAPSRRAFAELGKMSGMFDDFAVFPTASPKWMWSLLPPDAMVDETAANQPQRWVQLCHRRGKSMNAKGCQGVPRGTKGYQGVPRGTKGYQGVPRGTKGYQGVPRGTKGYQGEPRGTKAYQAARADAACIHPGAMARNVLGPR